MISLQFVNAADPGSRLIDWFGAGSFSHVDTVLPDGRLLGARSDRIGGAPRGVQIRTPGYERWTRRVVVSIPATESQTQTFFAFLHNQLGKPYDWRAILAFALNRDWRKRDAWFCSELQAAALEYAGVLQVTSLVARNKIEPVPLALMVCARPGVTWVNANNG